MLPPRGERALAGIARLHARDDRIGDAIDGHALERRRIDRDKHLREPRLLLGIGPDLVGRAAAGERRRNDVEDDRQARSFPEADRQRPARRLDRRGIVGEPPVAIEEMRVGNRAVSLAHNIAIGPGAPNIQYCGPVREFAELDQPCCLEAS